MRKFVLKSIGVALAAVACLGTAQAGVIPAVLDFDTAVDTTYAPFAPFMTHSDALIQDDYFVGTVSTKNGAQPGDLVGLLVDGTDVASDCYGVACPTGNLTTFLGMVNDGLPYIGRLDGRGFRINSFDAGFIAAAGATVPPVAMLMRVVGFTEIGGAFFEDELLPGASGGLYSFSTYTLSAAFAAREYVEVDFYGYACNDAGSCNRSSNKAQFALDNIRVELVPEPAPIALVALGLVALGAMRRRQAAA